MPRWIARLIFVIIGAALAAALGTATALLGSRPGKDLLARLVTQQSAKLVRGSLSIGRIQGDFLSNLTLDSVVIRDTTGDLLADVPRLELRFGIASLLAKRFVFTSVRATKPEIQIVKHRGGRMNYQDVLRLGEGPPGTGPSPLFELRDLVIEDGRVVIRAPWNPDGRLTTARQKDSALVAERAKPGRRIEPAKIPADGLQSVRVVSRLGARFGVLTIATPDRRPVHATIDSLAASISDPGIHLTDFRGEFTQGGDSLLFTAEHAALPHTVVTGGGRIDWPRDTVMFHLELRSPRVDLADLRWVSPGFPDFQGRGRVRAASIAGSRTEYTLTDLDLGDGTSRVRGRLVAITDVYRGLGFRGLDLSLENLDLEAVRPYLDTLPVAGWITGPLTTSGFFDGMQVGFDWAFRDARVEGQPESRLALTGELSLGGRNGIFFHDAELTRADLDLRTVRLITPAVRLDGRLSLAGRLSGPWRDVVFDGRVEHQDGDRPLSALTGRARLDTRGAVLGLDADLTVDTLSFDGIRRSFPDLTLQGSVGGSIRLNGDLSSLAIAGSLQGPVGRYTFDGRATLQPPVWAADSLEVEFSDVNLAAVTPRAPATRLQGRVSLTGRTDSVAAPEARVDLSLGAGLVREIPIDSARARFAVHDSIIRVDTAALYWEGGDLAAGGDLGWLDPHQGTIRGRIVALSLAPFDSLLHVTSGIEPKAEMLDEELRGRIRGEFSLAGSLDHWRLESQARVDSTDWVTYSIRRAEGTATVEGGRAGMDRFTVTATLDTLRANKLVFNDIGGSLAGRTDDFGWTLHAAEPDSVRFAAGGRWQDQPEGRVVTIDSVAANILGRRWSLDAPAAIRVNDSSASADSMVVSTTNGSGIVRLAGQLPWRAPGDLDLSALGVSLADLYTLLQRDTVGVGGTLALDVRLGGTLTDPAFRGSASVIGPVVSDRRAPLVRSVFDYRDRLLRTNLTFWRTGRAVLDVDASLPLDLALAKVPRRQIPGPLSIRAHADSVDLAVIEALSPNLRRVQGTAAIDARIGGTWDAPRLDGFVAVNGASLRVPGLGLGYGPIDGRIVLSGDSVIADSIVIHGGAGELAVKGSVQLAQLTRPILDLSLSAAEFPVINVPDYLTIQARGDVKLTGPIERPVLTGDALATNSVVYFADLISKDIVNLEDPLTADLVDTTALRAEHLGSQFQSRFLDSLTIRDLRFRVGENVWLRSNEANIQLVGQVTVNKEPRRSRGREYRVSGELTTTRGTYTLKLGPVFRTFTVEQGTVQYFNTPDMNAALDIRARHTVRTVLGGGEEYPVIARISGTLLVPKLSLSSAPDRAPLSERDLIALLVTGTTPSSLLSPGGSNLINAGAAAAIASTVLSSELQRSLISNPGAPFDLVEIRPGVAQGSGLFATGGTVTTLAVGRQLSNRLFLTLNLGGCLRTFEFGARYLGATLEYRLHPQVTLQVAAEPVQSCLTQVASALAIQQRYQFAADLKWDREY